jgi:hypothetical protein
LPIVDIPITAGVGTNVRSFQLAGGDYDQIVREVRASAKGALANIPWLATTTGLINVIGADVSRVSLVLVSQATGSVYMRYDATIPTQNATPPLYDWVLAPGDRYEVPQGFCQLAVSMVASTAGGYILAAAGTAA